MFVFATTVYETDTINHLLVLVFLSLLIHSVFFFQKFNQSKIIRELIL